VDSLIGDVIEQLRFLGYVTEESGEGTYLARHPFKPNLAVRDYASGCLIQAWYGTTAEAVVNRESFLEALNTLNARAAVSRFYVDKDFDLTIEAFYHGPYDRAQFALFMDLWDRDVLHLKDEGFDQYLS